jgi:hypothetical protein
MLSTILTLALFNFWMHSVTLLWLALSSRNDIEFFSSVDVGLHDLVGDGLHWEIFAGDVWNFKAIIPRE